MCKGVEIGAWQKESKWERIGQLPPVNLSLFLSHPFLVLEMKNKVEFGVGSKLPSRCNPGFKLYVLLQLTVHLPELVKLQSAKTDL